MTRREVVSRTASGIAALALTRSGLAQEPADRTIPPEVVTLEDFEALAQRRLSAQTFEIVRGGAADEITIRWNRDAFNKIALRPRVLVDVSNLNTRLTLFGQDLDFPIALAPAGVHGILHPEGELETARGATRAGAVLVIPSSPARPVEEIAGMSGRAPWYQIYISRDRGATREEAMRAENAGCRVLFVTVDAAAAGVRNGMMRPPFSPVATPGELRTGADSSSTWKDIAWLRSFVRVPIVLKGIMDPSDGDRAVNEGINGISVSNHGGRQLDSAAATIDALPPIGRPFLYGLAAAGADGVYRVVTILRQEFEMAMALTGRSSLGDIDRSVLW